MHYHMEQNLDNWSRLGLHVLIQWVWRQGSCTYELQEDVSAILSPKNHVSKAILLAFALCEGVS